LRWITERVASVIGGLAKGRGVQPVAFDSAGAEDWVLVLGSSCSSFLSDKELAAPLDTAGEHAEENTTRLPTEAPRPGGLKEDCLLLKLDSAELVILLGSFCKS
jgi:hypothetical protein